MNYTITTRKKLSMKATMKEIDKNPSFPWVPEVFSKNPNLTLEFILKNPNIPWSWPDILANINLQSEFWKQPDLERWKSSNKIYSNPTINVEIINHLGGIPSDLYRPGMINLAKVLDTDFIFDNWSSRWNTIAILSNNNLTFDQIIDNWDKFDAIVDFISLNANLKKIYREDAPFKWNDEYLMINSTITPDILESRGLIYTNNPQSWIAAQKFLPISYMLEKYPDYTFSLTSLSENPSLRISDMNKFTDFNIGKWRMDAISEHATYTDIFRNPNLDWYLPTLLDNKNLSFTDLQDLGFIPKSQTPYKLSNYGTEIIFV